MGLKIKPVPAKDREAFEKALKTAKTRKTKTFIWKGNSYTTSTGKKSNVLKTRGKSMAPKKKTLSEWIESGPSPKQIAAYEKKKKSEAVGPNPKAPTWSLTPKAIAARKAEAKLKRDAKSYTKKKVTVTKTKPKSTKLSTSKTKSKTKTSPKPAKRPSVQPKKTNSGPKPKVKMVVKKKTTPTKKKVTATKGKKTVAKPKGKKTLGDWLFRTPHEPKKKKK